MKVMAPCRVTRTYVQKIQAHPDEVFPLLCPVRETCLEYALTVREKNGVWGGLTERERRRVLRQRRKSA